LVIQGLIRYRKYVETQEFSDGTGLAKRFS
jgi:hypothetical protein